VSLDKSGEAVANRAQREKWFWVLNLPFCVVMWYGAYVLHLEWLKGAMILYLALVSVHALVKTCATEEQSAKSRGE